MRSRNLFLKSNSASQGRWWVILSVVILGSVVILMSPEKRKLDEWTWQSPIEPPGVTILTHEAQALIAPTSAQVSSVPAENQLAKTGVAPTAAVAADLPGSSPAAALAHDQAQIRKTIDLWSTAWSSRNMEAYFEQYAKSFVPAGGLSRAAWDKIRRQRILSKNQITHEVRDLQITVEGQKATANFEQMYATDQTRLVGPKTLQLQREGANWRIISESAN